MADNLRKVLTVIWRVLWRPFQWLRWLLDEMTGEHRCTREVEQLRTTMAARPPLTDLAFLEALAMPTSDSSTCLVVRRVIATYCYVPETALYPEDPRAALESLFRPPPGVHWADLGGDWFHVAMELEYELGVSLTDDEMLSERWNAARQSDRLQTLRQVTAWFTNAVAEAPRTAASHATTGARTAEPSHVPQSAAGPNSSRRPSPPAR